MLILYTSGIKKSSILTGFLKKLGGLFRLGGKDEGTMSGFAIA